jgi:hypothetical protein
MGGELDHQEVRNSAQAAQAAADMILLAGELYPGDKIVITGEEEGKG